MSTIYIVWSGVQAVYEGNDRAAAEQAYRELCLGGFHARYEVHGTLFLENDYITPRDACA